MIKYLECPDVHANKRWLETTLEVLETIKQTAIREKVDFIAFPGDLHDTDFYVSDDSGYNTFRQKIKELLSTCPVVAIQGTPGHESAGVYGPLEEMGLVLLKPGKVYGLYPENCPEESGVQELIPGLILRTDHSCECILFGIPELNKNNIQAALNLPAEQANAEAVSLFGDYIDSFVGPMRLKYKDIPAIALLHGNVSDSKQENTTDIILRSSDIVLHTEVMERAGIDRWSLGHIHTPWESNQINAGYAGYPGIDRNPWGKCGFVPAMNLIETGEHLNINNTWNTVVRSIDYGTPMRVKIKDVSEIQYMRNVAYWLVTEDPEAELPPSVHPWSRITFAENITETRRVTADEAEKARSLWDLFKLIDPDVDPDIKTKVDKIPVENSVTGEKLDVRLTYVRAVGCDLFGGKTVEFDLDTLATGLNQLLGTNGNGDGKSSLLGMCSLYPCVVGKDTKSGRQSALKDFFSGRDSSLEKTAIVNGSEHHHLITIKGAHTQSPKVECYLDIDGVPQLAKATFDTMFEKCQELYGDYEDYLLTTFYEQPQQSKSQRSGLMTATMTEARNLVQNIAGHDRESEKRFALDEVAKVDKSLTDLEAEITALDKYSENADGLEEEKRLKDTDIVNARGNLTIIEDRGNKTNEEVKSLQIEKTENETKKTLKTEKEKQLSDTEFRIMKAAREMEDSQDIFSKLPGNQTVIKDDDKNKIDKAEAATAQIEYDRIFNQNNNLEISIKSSHDRIEVLKVSAKELTDNQILIKQDDDNKKVNAETDSLELEYSRLLTEYNRIMGEYQTALNSREKVKTELSAQMDKCKARIESIKREKELIADPCEKCGHIKESAQGAIKKLIAEAVEIDVEMITITNGAKLLKSIIVPNLIEPIKPVEVEPCPVLDESDRFIIESAITEGLKAETSIEGLEASIKKETLQIETLPDKPVDVSVLSDSKRSVIENDITLGLKAESAIIKLQNDIKSDNTFLTGLQLVLSELIIDEDIDSKLETAEKELADIRSLYSSQRDTVKTLEAELVSINDRIEKSKSQDKELEGKKESYEGKVGDRSAWLYIAKMLNADKIPALELDIILDSIDAEATRNIEPFLEGRYSYHTVTQSHGKKTTVDRFDILVHDGETGESFSMFFTNPGNKAFYSDCYIKALIRQRNERQMRSYSPIIYDEADGPVNPLRVKAYYDIQQAYFQNEKVLIVSQKDITASYVEKVFNIEEMKS